MHFSDQPSDYSAPKIFLHNINSNEGALLKKAFEPGWQSFLSNPKSSELLQSSEMMFWSRPICVFLKQRYASDKRQNILWQDQPPNLLQ